MPDREDKFREWMLTQQAIKRSHTKKRPISQQPPWWRPIERRKWRNAMEFFLTLANVTDHVQRPG